MADNSKSRRLRIGVDVGGTNTDGVILDPLETSPDAAIKAWHKSLTTSNPSDGINQTIDSMFKSAGIRPEEVASITIGTTHFVNAVVETDASRLSPVAVLRLCCSHSKHAPPCIDWQDDLKEVVLGHYALLKGGIEIDGHVISDIDEEEIRSQCKVIKEKGIQSIVINGVFSPIDVVENQELRAADIVRSEIPGCDVVCSKDVANLGYLERENAAILNAAILPFARKTIASFHEPIAKLGLSCPVFISQNDGTVLSGEMALRLPIRTFSSGPTNSMRGAAFLIREHVKEDVMIVDIGGTTTDVGILQANGFPRQQAAYSDLAGVRMNFPCPDIKSIGLGGGSIVRRDGSMTIGPDSVGHGLAKEALVFGGSVATATDFSVICNPELDVGDRSLAQKHISQDDTPTFQNIVKTRLEKIVDIMKTSPGDIPVVLVGGGAIIAPDELKGSNKVLKPKWSQVANAIGAAIAKVSGVMDTVLSTTDSSTSELLETVKTQAIEKAVAAGAERSTCEIAEVDTLPLQYVANKTRFIVRVTGDFDHKKSSEPQGNSTFTGLSIDVAQSEPTEQKNSHKKSKEVKPKEKVEGYLPRVVNREWHVSETDLDWITTGCYILGTGGGGSPYSSMIRLRTQLRKGATVRIINPYDLADDAAVGCGSGVGSPTVGIEKLAGDEVETAQREIDKISDRAATHMISIEIGGMNGLQSMVMGISTSMDLPVVDGDWMGRAYPTKWQTTPVVFNERSPIWSPIAIADGSGNVVVMPKVASDAHVERIIRAALSEMGSSVGAAEAPVSGAETKRWAVEHTLSHAWRIGRGVARAREENRIGSVAEAILNECGGQRSGRVLWKGKIVGVERTLKTGHVYGECLIQGAEVSDNGEDLSSSSDSSSFKGILKIPFKNENIAAIKVREDGGPERQEDVLAIVPDLISVIDAQNGEAVGTPEYRYGLLVVVLGIAASDKWTGSERGLKLGGPEAFGFGHLKYSPLGVYKRPVSVIDEFDGKAV